MKHWFIRLIAAALCAVLLCSSALADSAGLGWAAGDYLQGDLRFHLTAQIDVLTPYGDGTLEMMNALLQNLSVSAGLANDGTDAELRFCVAGDPIVSLQEQQTDEGVALTTSLLPRRTLTSGTSVMDALSGFEQQETSFDLFAAIREAEACYQELADAILPFAEEKEANYNIADIGPARWVRLARMTPEQSAQIAPLIGKVLGCGMDEAFREQLLQMECQKSFVVALYRSKADGADRAVYIKGNVLFPDGAQRAISYQWAFAENSKGQRVDTYKFDMTKNKTPRDNRQITGTLKRSPDSSALLVDGQSKAIVCDPETNIVTTTTLTHDLSGKNGTIEGTVTSAVRTAQGETGTTTTTTVTPQLQCAEGEEGSVLTGSVRVEQTTGKNTHIALNLVFDDEAAQQAVEEDHSGTLYVVLDDRLPQSSLTQNLDLGEEEPQEYLVGEPPIGYTAYAVPEEEITVDVDAADAEMLAALRDEMSQRLAGSLLRAIAKLPQDAAALIMDNLSEADYAAFLKLLED